MKIAIQQKLMIMKLFFKKVISRKEDFEWYLRITLLQKFNK